MERLPVIHVSGPPADRGYQHGKQLRSEIERIYAQFVSETCSGDPPLTERDLLAYAWGHLPESRAYAPDLVEEIEGIAAGAGMRFEQLWLLNAWDEADAIRLYRAVNAGRACTSFAATGQSTADGSTIIAQNWDINIGYDPIILRLEPYGEEPGARIFTYPGTIAGSGINDVHIAIVINTVRSRDARNGVIWPLFIRRVLQQRKLSDALHAAVSGVAAEGRHFIIGSGDGAVRVEATARRARMRYIHRHLGQANHYDEPELMDLEGSSPARAPVSSPIRGGRVNQLLDEAAGRIDVAWCQRALSDHADYPGSICAHLNEPRSRAITRSGLIYHPATGKMWATNGQPCQVPWFEY